MTKRAISAGVAMRRAKMLSWSLVAGAAASFGPPELIATNLLVVCVTACALYFPPTPILPGKFEGPLSATADSVVASTQPLYCAPKRHLDFGTTPQGCVRAASDLRGWVNWTGAARVMTVGRNWMQSDSASAFQLGASMEAEITRRLGPPAECHYDHQMNAREVRWISAEPGGISTDLEVYDGAQTGAAPAHVTLIRTLGPARCGYWLDHPWTH